MRVRIRGVRHRGQSIIEYLLVATLVIAAIVTIRVRADTALKGMASGVATQMEAAAAKVSALGINVQ